jgi:hypothetical protein
MCVCVCVFQYIIIPTRRSTAESLQILVSHAFGDAGSPYLVGLTADLVAATYLRQDLVVEFLSLQYSLYVCCFMCVIGGGFFLATALFIQADRLRTEKVVKGAASRTPDSEEAAEELSVVGKFSDTPTDSTSSTTPSDSTSDDSSQPEQSSLLTESTLIPGNI